MATVPFIITRKVDGAGGVLTSLVEGILGLDESIPPFYQLDWPNPVVRLKTYHFLHIDNALLLNTLAVPFHQTEWPNPKSRNNGLIVDISSRPQNDGVPPFIPTDQPNPAPRHGLIVSIGGRLIDTSVAAAFNQLDWPNPGRKRSGSGYVFNRKLDEPTNIPFIPIDYPNPLYKQKPNAGSTISRPQYYQDIQPFAKYDWEVPAPKLLKSSTWVQNLLQTTLLPPFVQAPFNIPEFITPRRKAYLLSEISTAINAAPPTKPPLNVDFSNPVSRKRTAATWIQTRPYYYSDIKPFKQDNYPNPSLKLKSTSGYISNRKIDEPDVTYMPCSVTYYPNPSLKRVLALSLTSQISFLQQIFTHPVGNAEFSNPTLRLKPAQPGWIQPRPTYFTDSVAAPFLPVLLIPPIKRVLNNGFISTKQLTSIVGSPFKQNEWVNPLRRKPVGFPWEFYYQQDDNVPFPFRSTEVPLAAKRQQTLGWIYRSQGQINSGTPINVYIYPNPALLKRHVNTIIDSLLPHLNPVTGASPFYQNEWPNPLLGKRNFHSGWIENKKFYYTEPSIFITNSDWPIFRKSRRNDIGYITFRIPTSTPQFNTVDAVPNRAKVRALSFEFNSLIELNAISGIRPFNQTEWPLPLHRRVNRNILAILQALNLNLPNIVGRSICMLSGEIEYYLLSEESEYNLESQATEFDLDSGGTECQ